MKFSAYFEIRRQPEDDWFDPDLSVDTKLFLDPFFLLDEADMGGIWESAHDQLLTHFGRCYELLAKAGSAGTVSEAIALGLLEFPEPAELCLGYTEAGTSGLGSGAKNARLIRGSIVTAIAAGLMQPEHIEEIGILNEGIGADRISDATCNVLKPVIIEYTKEVVERHQLPTEEVRVRHARCDLQTGRWVTETHDLPRKPNSREAVLLVPRRFLNSLPVLNADDWFDSTLNADLRRQLNVRVGQHVPKAVIARQARRHPDRIRTWADQIRNAGDARGYDFDRDPLGIVKWQETGEAFAQQHPLKISVKRPADLVEFVETLIGLFKLFIEEQSGWRLLWNDDGSEKPEEAVQLALLGMARPYCRAHAVEIDREVNVGRGPVDFKLAAAAAAPIRLLIEAKKLHNGSFWNGLEDQLTSYMLSDQTNDGWLLAIQYRTGGISRTRRIELPRRVRATNTSLGTKINYSLIDARPKQSASRIRGRTTPA